MSDISVIEVNTNTLSVTVQAESEIEVVTVAEGPAGPRGPAGASGGAAASYSINFDRVSNTEFYAGYADPGSTNAQAVWMIKKVTTASGVTTVRYAGGAATFDNIWNNRLALVYS